MKDLPLVRTHYVVVDDDDDDDIVGFIKALRIRWSWHIEKMNEERVPKMIQNSEIDCGRRRGGPRKRWVDDLERDLRSL